MKYLLYRSFGNLDKDVKKHELVAVEYGKDIYDVTDALIKAAADDLAGLSEYEFTQPNKEASVNEAEATRHIQLARSTSEMPWRT